MFAERNTDHFWKMLLTLVLQTLYAACILYLSRCQVGSTHAQNG